MMRNNLLAVSILLILLISLARAAETTNGCGYVESIDGDTIRMAEATFGQGNPKTGKTLELKLTGRTVIHWWGFEGKEEVNEKAKDLLWNQLAVVGEEEVKKELTELVAQNVNRGNKVSFSFDPETTELHSLEIVSEEYQIHPDGGLSAGKSTTLSHEAIKKALDLVRGICGGE